jgi:hypothetical protein
MKYTLTLVTKNRLDKKGTGIKTTLDKCWQEYFINIVKKLEMLTTMELWKELNSHFVQVELVLQHFPANRMRK